MEEIIYILKLTANQALAVFIAKRSLKNLYNLTSSHLFISAIMNCRQVAQVNTRNKCSPLDSLQGIRVIPAVQGELFTYE